MTHFAAVTPAPDHGDRTPIVLASGSPYRARLLADAGYEAEVDPPDVDERSLDEGFARLGPEGHALDLARRKAHAVAPRHPGRTVVAADQVGVLDGDGGAPVMLTKQPTAEGAVAQLLALSGTTHRLVNGVVVIVPDGNEAAGVDVQVVTMRTVGVDEARAYVERFRPFDTAGSYRLEDQDGMPDGLGFVSSVRGEDPSCVVGLPIPLLRRLLAEVSPPSAG